jgi:hypothetical protein
MSSDLINKTIALCIQKGKRIEVVRRLVRMKYKIYLDQKSLDKRMAELRKFEMT